MFFWGRTTIFAAVMFLAACDHEPNVEMEHRGELIYLAKRDGIIVDGYSAFVIHANNPRRDVAHPWVWYAPTLPGLPSRDEEWLFQKLISIGISIAGVDVGESYGSPEGVEAFSQFYAFMVSQGYSSKPLLLGRSRGGLQALAWAASNPGKLTAFAGIYPVSNLASYPGINEAATAYKMTPDELGRNLQELNPINKLDSIALAKVPMFVIHGDSDSIVPLEENSKTLVSKYIALGGAAELVVAKGQGHSLWPGFFQSKELLRFIEVNVAE